MLWFDEVKELVDGYGTDAWGVRENICTCAMQVSRLEVHCTLFEDLVTREKL